MKTQAQAVWKQIAEKAYRHEALKEHRAKSAQVDKKKASKSPEQFEAERLRIAIHNELPQLRKGKGKGKGKGGKVFGQSRFVGNLNAIEEILDDDHLDRDSKVQAVIHIIDDAPKNGASPPNGGGAQSKGKGKGKDKAPKGKGKGKEPKGKGKGKDPSTKGKGKEKGKSKGKKGKKGKGKGSKASGGKGGHLEPKSGGTAKKRWQKKW